jgi:hypothetical protein
MTPPDTNLEKQKRRHRGPLIGISLAVAFAVGAFIYWMTEVAHYAPGPQDSDEQSAPAEIHEGTGDASANTPSKTIEPSDPEVEVVQ